jgi:hypothetical protein
MSRATIFHLIGSLISIVAIQYCNAQGVSPGRDLHLQTKSIASFYENADRTGISVTRECSAANEAEAVTCRVVQDFVTAGLVSRFHEHRRISAVRLQCGERDTEVYLFDTGPLGTNTSPDVWEGNVAQLSCKAHQTREFNLRDQIGHPGNVPFDNRAVSAMILVHATHRRSVPLFSSFVRKHWRDLVPPLIESEAFRSRPVQRKAHLKFLLKGEPKINLINYCLPFGTCDGDPSPAYARAKLFEIHQDATVVVLPCRAPGHFYATGRVISPVSGYGFPSLDVQVYFFVNDAKFPFGTSGACKMLSRLHKRYFDEAEREASRLVEQTLQRSLNTAMRTTTPFYPARIFYFSAQPHGSQFYLESDGLGPLLRDPPVKE